MKTLTFFLILIASSAFSQRDILHSNLSEYGTKMSYEEIWTDDEYIIMLAEGMVEKKKGHVLLIIHPEQGVVGSKVFAREAFHPYSELIYTSANDITVFYRILEKGKRKNYSLSFSKITRQIEIQEIGEDIEKIEKESIFSFMSEGRLLFASITKEKDKIGFREMTKEGTARVTHIYDMPDTLWQFINPKKSSFSKKVMERRGYVYGNSIRVIGTEARNKELTVRVFDFNLVTQKITINSITQPNKNKSIALSFAGDNLFFLKLSYTAGQPTTHEMELEILEYPTFRQLNSFICNSASRSIPFKSSTLNQVSFKTGLYFSGRKRKFSEPEIEDNVVSKLLHTFAQGQIFLSARPGSDNNIHLTIGSRSELLLTNTVITTISYFFGCVDYNFRVCSGNQKSSSEKIIDYLKSISKDKPDYAEFGNKRSFAVFNLFEKDEIVIKEF